jgi:hypothetical protein
LRKGNIFYKNNAFLIIEKFFVKKVINNPILSSRSEIYKKKETSQAENIA